MKRTTLKHLNTLACTLKVEFSDMFKGGFGRPKNSGYMTYSLNDTIWEQTSCWRDSYWFQGVEDAAMQIQGREALDYLRDAGLDVSPLVQGDPAFDPDLFDAFRTDVASAYCDANHSADEAEFYRLVVRDVEDYIEQVGAPYYTLLAFYPERGKRGEPGYKPPREVEVSAVQEATCVSFGFTRAWHQDAVATENSRPRCTYSSKYDPDEIEDWARAAISDVRLIDPDYRIQECGSDEDFLSFFGDLNEIALPLLNRQVAAMETNLTEHLYAMEAISHDAWVARTTRRMGV